MITIRNFNETPPGGWRYRVPQTGRWVPARYPSDMVYSWNDLETQIRDYYRANALEVPAKLQELVVEQMCEQLPPGWCKDSNRLSAFGRNLAAEFQRVLQGTATLVDWFVKYGRVRVPDAEVMRRSEICAVCIFNQPAQGCSGCNIKALNAAAEAIVGGSRLPTDAKLQSCMICGCVLSAKVRLPLSVLRDHLSANQLEQLPPAYPGFAGCWLRESVDQPSNSVATDFANA